uniref:Uncharacterized protein n=1 Tax=Suricata suricatta TaxID=37032 RepID=A0A673U9D5_SURSU
EMPNKQSAHTGGSVTGSQKKKTKEFSCWTAVSSRLSTSPVSCLLRGNQVQVAEGALDLKLKAHKAPSQLSNLCASAL